MSNAPHFNIDVPAFWADPYPDLAKMRRDAPIAFVPQLGSTVFTRRDDIFSQEKRTDIFSSHQPAGLMNTLMGHNMMRKDGDAHMSERAAMFPSVSPRTVRDTWKHQFQAHADRILDALAPAGHADLCKAFALPLSAECLKDVTGLTNMRFEDMDAWSQAMIDGIANYTGNKEIEARCHAATAGIDAAIDDMIPVVTKHPNTSILSVLLAAGQPLEKFGGRPAHSRSSRAARSAGSTRAMAAANRSSSFISLVLRPVQRDWRTKGAVAGRNFSIPARGDREHRRPRVAAVSPQGDHGPVLPVATAVLPTCANP